MHTKKEIVKFLEELREGVQRKLSHEDNQIIKYRQLLIEGSSSRSETQKNLDLLNQFQAMYQYTDGQLYEINYILSTITRDKKNGKYE